MHTLAKTDWTDIEEVAVKTDDIVVRNRAGLADPRESMRELAERIATRAGYAKADGECMSVARKMFAEIGDVETLLAAFDRREKDSFFVSVCEKNPPGFQIRQVVAEAKRGGTRRRAWSEKYDGLINR